MAGHPPRHVVICGGGVAGVEALLALRALMQVGVEVHLVAPNHELVYQPLAVAEPFGLAETHRFDLASIASDQHATLHADSLARVDAGAQRVVLASGVVLPYDALLVAVGARPCDWLQGALHFSGAESVTAFRALLEQVEGGSAERLCFVNPAGASWELPLYELALLTASHLAEVGVVGVELAVVTPEVDPLEMFGPAAGRMMRDLLADRGIALKAGAYAEKIEHGELRLHSGATFGVDHAVAIARLEGPSVPGLPSDEAGFIPVDGHSRVTAFEHVYAAGDGTNFPVKHGGIAAQQADAAAEAIAAQMGVPVTPAPMRPTLRAMLLTGIAPTFMRVPLDGTAGGSSQIAANPLWWPPSKIAGRHLAPYLAGHNALTRDQTLEDRGLSTQDPDKLEESYEEARELALAFAERDAADRHFSSALDWLEVIERLDGVLPPGYLHKRADWEAHAHA